MSRPDFDNFDSEPWEARIEYDGSDGMVYPSYFIYISQGVFLYGPGGGPFTAFTYKGAKRVMERELRKARKRQVRKLAFREMESRRVPE
jgi:hypothetical protein